MAVALDAAPGAGNNGNYQDFTSVATATYAGLTTVAPTLILACLIFGGTPGTATGVGITWNGVAMSQLSHLSNGTDQEIYVFGLLNSTAGNHNIVASWTGSVSGLLTAESWKGTDTSSLSTAVPAANIITLSQTVTALTADPNSALAVTTASGDAATAFCASNPLQYGAASTGTFDATASGVGAYNGWCGHNLAVGTTTNIQFNSGAGPAPGNCIHIALRIQQPQSSASLPPGQHSYGTPDRDDNVSFPRQLRSYFSRRFLGLQDVLPPGQQRWDRPLDPQDPWAQWRAYNTRRFLGLQDVLPPGQQRYDRPPGIDWQPATPQQNLLNTLYTTAPPAPPPGRQLYARPLDPIDPWTQWRSYSSSRFLGLQDFLPPGQQNYATPYPPQAGLDYKNPSVNVSLILQPPPGQQRWDRPPGIDWHPDFLQPNILASLYSAIPPGQQLWTRPPDIQDLFAQWRSWASFNPNLFPPPPPPALPPGKQLYSRPIDPLFAGSVWSYFNPLLNPPTPPAPIVIATYYLLEDYWSNAVPGGIHLPAGTIQQTFPAGFLPQNWIPGPNVDPVDANAIAAYTAAGFQVRGLSRMQYSNRIVFAPNYVWKIVQGQPQLVKVADWPRNQPIGEE